MTVMTVTFADQQHRDFFFEKIQQARQDDVYHQSLLYLLALSETTRTNFKRIYNLETGLINPNCVYEAWNTSSTLRLISLAFNLYTNGTPVPEDIAENDAEELAFIKRNYSPVDIFSDYEYFPYFVQALKIRFGQQEEG